MKARRLVEESAQLGDLTEVYKAQIATAQRERRKVLRAPLLKHLERLESLAHELETHQPYLKAAKEAFLAPESRGHAKGLPCSPMSSTAQESPVVIIQPRSRPMFGSLGRVPKEYMTKFLETAIDFVTAAATATGMGAESPETRAEEAVDSAVGCPPAWLDLAQAPPPGLDSSLDDQDWSSAQTLWARGRRKGDRRWSLG